MNSVPGRSENLDGSLRRAVQVEIEVQTTFKNGPGKVEEVLDALRSGGGELKAHLLYRLGDQAVGFFLCQHPTEAALALKRAGFPVETETVVTALTENGPGALAHLVRTLAAEGIGIGYSYSAATPAGLLAVFRTTDDSRAEGILRDFLLLPQAPAPLGGG